MIGNFDKALEQINKVINDLNPLNGKCEYIKALIFIKMEILLGLVHYCPLQKIQALVKQNQFIINFVYD